MSNPNNPFSLRHYDNLTDRIRQHRQVDKRPIVIVEGTTDEEFLVDVFGEMWALFSAAGRANVISHLKEVLKSTDNVYGVVDRDFDDEVAAAEAERLPVMTYRNADLEGMLASQDTLKVVLGSFGREGATNLDLAQVLSEVEQLTRPISLLRRANYLREWGLKFDAVEPAEKINQRDLNFNVVGYCQALVTASLKPPPLSEVIEVATGKTPTPLPTCPHGAVNYYNGKDFAAVLGVFLRKKLGSLTKSQTERKHVCAILRSSAAGRIRRDRWAIDLENQINPIF
ncbi:DUF4435 domain-containing protein [Streptomyces microflavus]|uniref:DUF4435 domain-containing protein n=1 Tax=Streptomyces microflavus TaxID=1919 RepID=UPI003697E5D6